MTGAACCCLAWALSGPVLAAEKLPSGAFLQDPIAVGSWSIRRLTSDEAGRAVLSCQASWTREADLYVHVSRDVANKTFALGIPTLRPPRNRPATMRVWFDDDKANATEGPATFIPWSGDDEGEDGYLVLVQTGETPPAAERIAKARKVTFAYPFEGKTRIEAFPYKAGGKAIEALADCASGR